MTMVRVRVVVGVVKPRRMGVGMVVRMTVGLTGAGHFLRRMGMVVRMGMFVGVAMGVRVSRTGRID
jgi:hypothetical protein